MFVDDSQKKILSELEAKRILDELAKKTNIDLTILPLLTEEIYLFWKFADELGLTDIPRVCVFSKSDNGVQFIGISNLENVYSDSASGSFQDELYSIPIDIYKGEQDREQAIDSLTPYAEQNGKDKEYVTEKWNHIELTYCLDKKVDRVRLSIKDYKLIAEKVCSELVLPKSNKIVSESEFGDIVSSVTESKRKEAMSNLEDLTKLNRLKIMDKQSKVLDKLLEMSKTEE